MVGKIERNKDVVQQLVESAATHVGRITVIITGAVAGVAREIGDWVTDGFEMVEAAKKADEDGQRDDDRRQVGWSDRFSDDRYELEASDDD
ncbi:hypothetical protein IEU95_03240 [Hoyosella rhizosphaerae]|uniref:Uncharacterized protein n=1 Tax=Hoyosella rhizosphaerae TaxID=1755582 RepID=A0A916UBR6_9ACTN|nr:hypothetical protein [Hoyosella rhizosphaerae]MBN4925829.1 hypothetical protein [Hoyosella rhizosphaerae]GGC67623.1 hypothetical protein GCM10011410_20410 [Hoyosella rhizosphaerae]